jgi:guanylate kinase
MRSGRLVVLSGPSGVGKTTVGEALLKGSRRLRRSVSVTTRPRRAGEHDGRDYHFVTEARFRSWLRRGEFLEHARVHRRRYGTLRGPTEVALRKGRDVLLVIDVQGSRQIRRKAPGAVTLFLLPPGWGVLEARLRGRGTEDPETLRTRLATARRELREQGRYDHVLVNDRLEDTVRAIRWILYPGKPRQTRPLNRAPSRV